VKEKDEYINDVLGKYLSGEATAEEIDFVEKWIAATPENRKYFQQLKIIFTSAARMSEVHTFNADIAWDKVRNKLRNADLNIPKERRLLPVLLRIAASILAAVAVVFAAYRYFAEGPLEARLLTEVNTKADTLPDGTAVFLNKKTELLFIHEANSKRRVVRLKGEAFFEIKAQKENDFLVSVDDLFIRDIGTAFNVKAYPGSATIEIFVQQGEVICYTDADTINLGANMKVVYDKATRKFTSDEPKPNELAYKTRAFVFNDMELRDVAEQLNSVYGHRIEISAPLTTCRLSVSFNGETLDEVVSVIAETLDLTVKRSGDIYLLEGAGCPD